MSFRDQMQEEVEQSKTRNSGDEREELETIDIDFGTTKYVNFHPTTFISGTFPEGEGNPLVLKKDEQRLDELGDAAFDENGNDLRYVSTRRLWAVMDDIHAVVSEDEGTADMVVLERDDGNEVRFFNASSDLTEVREEHGEIKHDGRLYEGEIHDAEDYSLDRGIVNITGSAYTAVAQKLDVNGGTYAGMDPDTGNINDGLIEYAPDGENTPDNRRFARPYVELREELYGAEVGIFLDWRSNVDEEFAELVADGKANDTKWFSVFNMDTGESLSPVEGDPITSAWLEWSFDPSVGPDRLPDDQYQFVQDFITAVEEDGVDSDTETIVNNIEGNDFDTSPNTDRIVEMIQDRV